METLCANHEQLLLIPAESLLLAHAPVDGNGGEVLLYEELGEGNTPLDRLDKDDDLVEFQHIQKLKQLPVLLRVLQLDIVLSQSVQCQLGLVVDVNLHWLKINESTLL